MTPERRAELVAHLREAARHERWAPFHSQAMSDAADALESMGEAPKSAEASMKERIEGLEKSILQLRERTARLIETRCSNPVTGSLLAGLVRGRDVELEEAYREALHGPSDPDRDREAREELMKP